jgi:radical SAM superfamily enzyme YgiQ (UPF0313 family)
MNILLVYPKMPTTYMTMEFALEFTGKKAVYPPLGLLTIAAMLPREWNKRVVDTNVNPLTDEAIAWADYVFLSAMNVQVKSVREIVARCNALGTRIVAGGPLFTHEHEDFPTVDHFVLNEGEITLPLFLADLGPDGTGTPKPLYATKEFADVRETPIPQWDLIDLDDYVFAIMQYSRGCPYMCEFCDVTALFGRKMRTKPPAQVLAELEALGDLSRFDLVLFADDNLIGNARDLKQNLLPALIDWRAHYKYPVNFATQLTITLADDPELMRLLRRAGFGSIFCGIESPDEETLIAIKKRQNTKRNLLENIHRLHAEGFTLSAGFIVGFDEDTPEGHQRLIEFIQATGIVFTMVNLLKAPPGTALYTRMRNAGRLIEPFNFEENESNIIPIMDPELLHVGYERVIRTAYSPEHMYARVRVFLKDFRKRSRERVGAKRRVQMRDIRALFLVIWKLGLTGNQRREFWKHIGWTLARYPGELRSALMFSILTYHFQKMYELYVADSRKFGARGQGLISARPATVEMETVARVEAAA